MGEKRTKIVCTIGPASSSETVLREMIRAGMNVARLNFSHGTHEEHAAFIADLRRISEEEGEPLAILQDLQGPKIRTGDLPKEGVVLAAGARVTFTTGEARIPEALPVTYDRLHEDVKAGERLLFDDGLLSSKVIAVRGRDIICEVIDGGTLFPHKGMNFPDTALRISAITEKDAADVAFGVSQGVDWVALSFVRGAAEIRDLRAIIAGHERMTGRGGSATRIIAKIEKPQAVDHIAEIIEASDAIMVARGDLGIEMPAEDVPLIQKELVRACLAAAKPVVVATQMLDSMIRNPRPTRAEVSDVANAVIDHADAIMLSGETAGGKHPIEAVSTMARIAAKAEASTYDDLPMPASAASAEPAAASAAAGLARETRAAAILCASASEGLPQAVSRYRTEAPIYAACTDARRARQLNLSWGVCPVIIAETEDPAEAAISQLIVAGRLHAGDALVTVNDRPHGVCVEIRRVE